MMGKEVPVDILSASPPSPSTMHRNGEQDRDPMIEAEVDVRSFPLSSEEIVDDTRGDQELEGNREIDYDGSEYKDVGSSEKMSIELIDMQYHLCRIAEIEEFALQYIGEEISVSPGLRQSLPPAIEALLLRLEASSPDAAVMELKREDLRSSGFGTLFGGFNDADFDVKFGQMGEDWVAGVRLLIMTAAGNCKTLEVIDVSDLSLTFQELKALLEPLWSSLLLRQLNICDNDIAYTKHGCKVVADFLKVNRSVRVLHVSCYMDWYLRHYLLAYGHPTLQVLHLQRGNLRDEEIAGIVRACPNLQQMPNSEWGVMHMQTAEMYAQVLIEHQSFCHLRLYGRAGPESYLLLSACTGARSATSLAGLTLSLTGADSIVMPSNTLRPVFVANKNLEHVEFLAVETISEEWEGVLESLKQNGALRRLILDQINYDEEFTVRAWDQLVALVQEGSKLELLHISSIGSEYHHDRCALIDAVASNKKMLNFTIGSFHFRSDESRAIALLICKNTPLTSLTLKDLFGVDWKEVFSSLRYNNTLKELVIRGYTLDDRDLEALITALHEDSALTTIDVDNKGYKEDVILRYALQEKGRRQYVTYAFVSTCTENREGYIRSLQQNPILQHLFLSFSGFDSKHEFDPMAWEALETLLAGSRTLESLTIFGHAFYFLEVVRLIEAIRSQKSIHSLALRNVFIISSESEALLGLLTTNTSLTQLTFYDMTGVNWTRFFAALPYNGVLQTLTLSNIDELDEAAFKELLAALQVNSCLKEIDIRGTNWWEEGKDPLLQKALKEKGRRETYMADMREVLTKEHLDVPNTGRLFLCGAAWAGKSQLRVALTQVASRRTKNGGCARSCVQTPYNLRRTEGIEIEVLNIESLQVAIWDLAGQDIFRTLQDVLFPKLNMACVFLLVFSPFVEKTSKLKPALSGKLHTELLPWLRFIASNTPITSYILPQVKFVISHRDKLDMESSDISSRLWAKNVISSFRLQFAEILDIDETIFCTDSTGTGQDVEEVLNRSVQWFEYVLEDKLFKVPVPCLTLASVLAKRGRSQAKARSHRRQEPVACSTPCISLDSVLARIMKTPKSGAKVKPILPTSEFFELCQREVPSIKSIRSSDQREKLMCALAKYLHDAGNIIQFAESDVVVVDPNWFTYSFMGRLIGAGHNFQEPIVRVDNFEQQKDGHLTNLAFNGLLQKFAQKLRDEDYYTVEEDLLEKLIRELELCFPVPHECRYFAPAIFPEKEGERASLGLRKLEWKCVAEDSNMGNRTYVHVGIRVQCRDRNRTSLTPSCFPRFQVHFRNLLILNRLEEDKIVCDYNTININFSGYEVYVESDGNAGDHIDVLVRSLNSRSETLQFIQAKVVKEIQDFCATCCSGVELVLGVLRTECVRVLTLSAYRDEHQAILIDDLRKKWQDHILNLPVNDQGSWGEKQLGGYMYTWPSSTEANLGQGWEKARDLLTDEQYLEVLQSVKPQREKLERQLDNMKGVEKEIEEKVKVSSSVAGSSRSQTSSQPSTSQVSGPSASLLRAFSFESTEGAKTRNLIRVFWLEFAQKMDEFGKDLEKIRIIVEDIQTDVINVQRCQQEILETIVSINGKLDRLTHVTASLGKAELPSRPYFTRSDVKWTHRISAAVNVGEAMTLHFMCEERSENHLVKDQGGYPITVSKDNKEVLRFLCVNSVRVLWYLLKAGVHVAAGLGNVIPDLDTGSQTALLTASALGSVLVDGQYDKFDQTSVDGEAWQYLKQLFSEPLKGKCPQYFGLFGARYTAPAESRYAWLCKECIDKARMNRIIDA